MLGRIRHATVVVGASALAVVLAALVGSLLPQVAPGAADATARANSICQSAVDEAAEYGTITGVERAEISTAREVAEWQEQRVSEVMDFESDLRALPAAASVTVCIYPGQFVLPAGVDANGQPNLPPTRIRVLILPDGSFVLDSAGRAGTMTPETPSDLASGGQR